jgi:hypothetical protein
VVSLWMLALTAVSPNWHCGVRDASERFVRCSWLPWLPLLLWLLLLTATLVRAPNSPLPLMVTRVPPAAGPRCGEEESRVGGA